MKKIIFLILIIFIIPISYADLIITPSGYSGQIYVGVSRISEIWLNNTFTFPIYNISFTDSAYIKYGNIPVLQSGEVKSINATILSNVPFSQTSFNSPVKFWYSEGINLEPIIHDVNISNDLFSPNPISIRIGDRIRFNNIGNYYASLKDQYSPYKYFDLIINSNTSVVTNAFNQIDDFSYIDSNIFKTRHIIVNNISSALINNPDFNKFFTFNLESRFTGSTLNLEIYPQNNLTIAYNDFSEISLRIWNANNSIIYNVFLNIDNHPEWFSIENNNFTLSENQNRFIKIRIAPNTINISNQTNITYNFNIIASATNAPTQSISLKVFVPYSEYLIDYNSLSRQELIDQIKLLKASLESLFLDAPNNTVVYIEKNSTIEYSKEEALANDRRQNERLTSVETLQEKQTKSLNELSLLVTTLNTNLETNSKVLNDSNNLAKESQKTAEDMTLNSILIIIILLFISGGVLIFINIQRAKKRNIQNTT